VGASATQMLTLTNVAPVSLPVPVFVTTGNFSVSTAACGTTLATGASCMVNVIFNPQTTGPLTGTMGVNSSSPLYSGLGVTMTGTGVDFSLSLNPASGSLIAGDSTSTTATLTPIAGFAAQVSLSCVFPSVQGAACGLATASVTPTAPVTTVVSISTTSQFTVIGYGGLGGGWMWIVGVGSGWMLWMRRRRLRLRLLVGLLLVTCVASSVVLSGCSGKLPTQNPVYTGPGNYTVTVSATDGFLVHTASYKLTVSAQ
jgi:hypothetical protein